ncbi:MAG: protein-glutamate O-methyltransferase CheR [Gammaproteobacteria bacterium]
MSAEAASVPAAAPRVPPLAAADYERCRALIYRLAGINLGPHKQALVSGRLGKRLAARGLTDWTAYMGLLENGEDADELREALDLLTTNETYFFREPRHFQILREQVLPGIAERPVRIWSAACSSGEEAYSLAMTLDDALGPRHFEVHASDISNRVLARAMRGHYPVARLEQMPPAFLRRYCLKGVGAQSGTLLVEPGLRRHVQFRAINLVEPLPPLPRFHAIFLRNVMIYFDDVTRQRVVRQLVPTLVPGGWLFVGHSENLRALGDVLESVAPAVYRRR